MQFFAFVAVLFLFGCSLIAAQSCSLPGNVTVVMPNFATNISDPYELVVSSSVVLKNNNTVVMREQMNFLEWGSDQLVDIECRSTTSDCVKRWIFDGSKKGLTTLMKDTSCDWYDTRATNFSINVLVGGLVYYDNNNNKSNGIVSGFKDLLKSFSSLNAVKSSINISEQAFAFDFGVEQVSLYTICVYFPQLNSSGSVEVYVVDGGVTTDKDAKEIVGADKPYLVRISLMNIDKGILLNNNKSNELVNASLTFRVTYHKAPFTRSRSPSDMVVPLDVYCPFPTGEKNMTLPSQKNIHITLEESMDEDKSIVIRDERIDFDAKLVRRTFVLPNNPTMRSKKIYSMFDQWMIGYTNNSDPVTTIHLIHDYNFGVEWAVIPTLDRCVLRKIPLESPEASLVVNSTKNVQMDKGLLDILNVDPSGYIYYGESTYRAMPVSVFGAKKTDFPTKGSTAVIKLFLASSSWSMDTVNDTVKSPVVGIQIYVSNGTSSYRYKANIVQVEIDQAPDFWLGDDFRSCAGNVPSYSVSFNDSGAVNLLCDALAKSAISETDLEAKLADSIAQKFGVSRLRVGDILFSCHPNGTVFDVSFRIVDRLNPSVERGNVANEPTIDTLRDIIATMNSTLNAGNWTLVFNAQKVTYSVAGIKTTLRLANETVFVNGTSGPIIYNQTLNGHTAGEMAGLAFAMLAVGVMAALFGVYLYQRRRNAQFSYMVQE